MVAAAAVPAAVAGPGAAVAADGDDGPETAVSDVGKTHTRDKRKEEEI